MLLILKKKVRNVPILTTNFMLYYFCRLFRVHYGQCLNIFVLVIKLCSGCLKLLKKHRDDHFEYNRLQPWLSRLLASSGSSISMSCCLSRTICLWENSSLSLKLFELNHKVREWCVESSPFLTWVTQTRLLSWFYSRQTRVWDHVIRLGSWQPATYSIGSRDQTWLARPDLTRTLAFCHVRVYLGFLESSQLDESDSSCSLVQVGLTKSSVLDLTHL